MLIHFQKYELMCNIYSVCCRSPILPVRLTFSADMLNQPGTSDESNIWTNPLANGTSLENISKTKVRFE